MAILTKAILTKAILTMAILTMAILTMATLTALDRMPSGPHSLASVLVSPITPAWVRVRVRAEVDVHLVAVRDADHLRDEVRVEDLVSIAIVSTK